LLNRWQFTTLTMLAALTVALMLADIALFTHNRITQTEVAARAQHIQQAVQLRPLYQEMVKALADLSVRHQDHALRDLLTAQGITLTLPPAPFAAPASPTPAPEANRPVRK